METIGQYEDRQGDLDFISKYSQANGPRINVERLRKLATAGSSLRLFEGTLDLASSVYTVLSSIGRRYGKVITIDDTKESGSENTINCPEH